jgi:hypothetical protein
MRYDALRLIIASQKSPIPIQSPSDSFFQEANRFPRYIEPGFSKIEYAREKPAFLLVSAVGATGKTTTAHTLSFDIKLPILDLAKHKPVADNTLTGVLTNAYPVEKIGAVLDGLRKGTHGIIIDGIDEGRSKTTEEGFEAFLDDLITRSKGSTSPAIIIFGRSQVLYTTWLYLVDKGAEVGLVQIDPFDLEQARQYIDSRVTEITTGQLENYKQARDGVLARLGSVFSPSAARVGDAFLSFIGYPPVLDAIATLLDKERNYLRIQQALTDGAEGLEIDLLIRICDYLLDRDHQEKALPNFVESIASDAGPSLGQVLRKSLYNREEQCARVLSRALNRPFCYRVIEDNALNERYEGSVGTWCQDHPFLEDSSVRNVVFAAVSVARCALSPIPEYQQLANDYAAANRPTYLLLYMLGELSDGLEVSVRSFNMLVQSCSEFLGLDANIAIDIEGDSWEDTENRDNGDAELTIAIEFPEKKQARTFVFRGVGNGCRIPLGPYLINADITLPGAIDLRGTPAVEAIGACSISARSISIDSPDLVLRSSPRRPSQAAQGDAGFFVSCHRVEGHVNAVTVRAGELEIQCAELALD